MEERELKALEEVLERIRPALERHHGNLKVMDVKEGNVYLQFEGACTDCPIMDASVKDVVVMALKGNLPWVKEVHILPPRYTIA